MSSNVYNHFWLGSKVIAHSLGATLKLVDEFLFVVNVIWPLKFYILCWNLLFDCCVYICGIYVLLFGFG